MEERIEKLEELSKSKTLRSCYEYSMTGIKHSGYFHIDPDGDKIGHEPFEVYCDFEDGSTQIPHDHELATEITPCPESMCFQLNLNYSVSMEQIVALKDISESCSQDIQFNCFLAPLTINDDPIGVWLNKDGQEETYFVGANHGKHICTCGLSQNCSESEHDHICNCDAQLPVDQFDYGTITNSTALPVTGFKYGNMEFSSQHASIEISRMKCKGTRKIEPEHLMDSCSNLKAAGAMSGNYVLNDGTVSFCDMTRQIYDPTIQRHIGKLRYNDVL